MAHPVPRSSLLSSDVMWTFLSSSGSKTAKHQPVCWKYNFRLNAPQPPPEREGGAEKGGVGTIRIFCCNLKSLCGQHGTQKRRRRRMGNKQQLANGMRNQFKEQNLLFFLFFSYSAFKFSWRTEIKEPEFYSKKASGNFFLGHKVNRKGPSDARPSFRPSWWCCW